MKETSPMEYSQTGNATFLWKPKTQEQEFLREIGEILEEFPVSDVN